MITPAPAGRPGIDWNVPNLIVVLTLVFFAANLAGVLNLRGVADPEGYVLNTSRLIPVNTHEDDGHLNITAMLGHLELHKNKFSYYFNIGGPFLLFAQGAAAVGDTLGLVKRFDDPTLYWLYPEELKRAWQFFGMLKLAFLMWLPVVVFWFANNHLSRRSGLIGAALVAAMPFVPGFEQRMKVDSVVIALGLLSLLFQVAYARWGRDRDLLYGAAVLALSMSMKFVMLPAVAVFLWCFILGERARGERALSSRTALRAAKTCALAVTVFFLSNPRFIPGVLAMASDYTKTISASHAAVASHGLLDTLLYRLTSLGPLAGSWADALALPVLAISLGACLLPPRQTLRTGVVALLAFFVLDFAYLFAFVGAEGARTITYYFFAASVVLCMLTGFALDMLATVASRLSPTVGFGVLALAAALVAASFVQQTQVLVYVLGPTNRQRAQAWMKTYLPQGASVGVPMPADAVPLNSLYWSDPYRHQAVVAGTDLELLGEKRPDYVLRILGSKARKAGIPAGYTVEAEFADGVGLSGDDNRDMFQDEAYQVLRRTGEAAKSSGQTAEYRLISFLERDPEPVFNVMEHQASIFFPISLEMLRKIGGGLVPFPLGAFASSIRAGGKLAYIHQIPPGCLTLWGVKYLLAPAGEGSPLRSEVLRDGRYPLTPAQGWEAGAGPELFRNTAYEGQAVFIPEKAPLARLRANPSIIFRSRGRLPLSGDLATQEALMSGGSELVQVSLTLETDRPVDCIFSGGPRPMSVLLDPGYHEVRLPYHAAGPGALRYEINPVTAPARVVLHAVDARPMSLRGAPMVEAAWTTPREAFARVDAPAAGTVAFALPWHRYWRASLDGSPVEPQRGPGNTVAVPVPAGRHQAALTFGK